MNSPDTLDLLNRLHVLQRRSLPMYLGYAAPWEAYGCDPRANALTRIVENQKLMADRLASMILDLGGTPDYGHFPMFYTALNDTSLEYTTKVMLERQQREVAAMEKIADALRLSPVAHALALEALGESKAHLDLLEEMLKSHAGAV